LTCIARRLGQYIWQCNRIPCAETAFTTYRLLLLLPLPALRLCPGNTTAPFRVLLSRGCTRHAISDLAAISARLHHRDASLFNIYPPPRLFFLQTQHLSLQICRKHFAISSLPQKCPSLLYRPSPTQSSISYRYTLRPIGPVSMTLKKANSQHSTAISSTSP